MIAHDRVTERFPFPRHGWAGLIIIITGQLLLAAGFRFVAIWLTPIMWTGYILAVDGLVYRFQHASWLTTRRREFPFLALISIGVWLIFEAYNFHLQNWLYREVPSNPLIRDIAYFWSFATIMPCVFETAELIQSLLHHCQYIEKVAHRKYIVGPPWLWHILGIALVIIPLTLPTHIAAYFFGAVWIGFIFLLDPINELMNASSLRRQLSSGDQVPAIALLISGMICGFLWETWNFQALVANGGHWVYTIPEPLRIFGWHYGKMPVLGLLGFPLFALELSVFYSLLREVIGADRVFSSHADGK